LDSESLINVADYARAAGTKLAKDALDYFEGGALDEITQIPVHRDCDFWDWTADSCGAAAGVLLYVLLRKFVGERIRYRD
jgi:hypothetical protein